MKTTKKSIELAVRSNDVSLLFKMFRGDREQLYQAIGSLTIKKLAKRAYDFAYGSQHKLSCQQAHQVHSKKVEAILFAKSQVKDGSIKTDYAKMLIEGNSNIYWASPVYGHSDYNKSIAFENSEENRDLAKKINAYLIKNR